MLLLKTQQAFTVLLSKHTDALQSKCVVNIFPIISEDYILVIQLYAVKKTHAHAACVSSANSLNVTAAQQSLVQANSVLLHTFLQIETTVRLQDAVSVQVSSKTHKHLKTSWSSVCPYTMVTCLCFLKPSSSIVVSAFVRSFSAWLLFTASGI